MACDCIFLTGKKERNFGTSNVPYVDQCLTIQQVGGSTFSFASRSNNHIIKRHESPTPIALAPSTCRTECRCRDTGNFPEVCQSPPTVARASVTARSPVGHRSVTGWPIVCGRAAAPYRVASRGGLARVVSERWHISQSVCRTS